MELKLKRAKMPKNPQPNNPLFLNKILKSHLGSRHFSQIFTLYKHFRQNYHFTPDGHTFVTLAKAASLSGCVNMGFGMGMHCEAVKFGWFSDMYVSTAFVDMYGKFKLVGFAKRVFEGMRERSAVTWTALVSGYLRSGDIDNARAVFDNMVEKDSAAFNAMIDGYVKVGEVENARRLFDEMPVRNVVSWTSMVYGYCKDGDVGSARVFFDAMPVKNLVAWNAMIGGYCKNGKPNEAVELFRVMLEMGCFELDEVTVVSVLPAIADLGALDLGDWVYGFVKRRKLDGEVNVGTALVDMYAKCGEVVKAKRVFDDMPRKEVFSWNALINGFAVNGCAEEAFDAFSDMQREGVKPNEVTMLGVLSACNHCGLVEEGRKWFKAMEGFGVVPKIEHYGCMVDLLGRAGCTEEAERLIESMPFEANGIILSSFLVACGSSKDIKRATRVLDDVRKIEPYNDGNFVMLRNLYAMEGRWKEAGDIKGLMWRHGVKKEVGRSVIKIGS